MARLAGHNAATFDGPRLKDAFQRYEMFLPAHPLVMCSLQRAMWYAFETGTKFENLKLETLARHFGVPVDDSTHTPLTDCRLAIAITRAMQEQPW